MRFTLALLLLAYWPFSDIKVDPPVKPGDDFFAYANAAWLKSAVIPEGKDRWSVRDEINERTRRQLATILDEAPGVAAFRAALLDEAAIEKNGVTPLRPMFSRIDDVADKRALARLLGSTMQADVDPFNFGVYDSASVLGFSVEHSIHAEKHYSAILLQGGVSHGDQKYIARMLTLAGFDHGDQRAASVLALETAIAATHATNEESGQDRNADNEWSRADFDREAPGMDWPAFFEAAGLDQQPSIIVWQPKAVKGVAALVAAQPLEAWKDYLRFHLLDDNAFVLPRAFDEAAAAMHGETRTRDQRALAMTQTAMAGPIGELYAKRYFSPADKARVRSIIDNVAAEFREHVAHVAWLSPASRKTALEKIDRLYVGIGYPETWEDWSDLHIDPNDAFGNAQRVAASNCRHALARLAKPYDPHEWVLNPQQVAAVLTFQQNAYLFSAALLQRPKYDPAMSDAAAYGAIGAIIGHDMSHFVDVLGADYEPDGRMHHWWTAGDMTSFEAAADPLVRQFSAYPGVDGRLTRTENVADLAGLTAAFEAYRKHAVKRNDREFFIAFAQAFAAKLNEKALRAQLATDHAPEMYRMNTVRNLDAWYEAFDVKPGQKLYLEPQARVRIW